VKILCGEDELKFYDYKAFRYVNLITEEDNLDSDSFCAIVRHHTFAEKCKLVSDVEEDGLLTHVDEKWNLVDWPSNLRDGYVLGGGEHDAMRPCHNVLNAYYIRENIKGLIMSRGLNCGTRFSYFVLKALGSMGAYKEELALLTNESEHSWVNMLREGATTCFEAWGKEQKANTSLCHPWASAPVIVLIEDILRLDPRDFGRTGEPTVLELKNDKL